MLRSPKNREKNLVLSLNFQIFPAPPSVNIKKTRKLKNDYFNNLIPLSYNDDFKNNNEEKEK